METSEVSTRRVSLNLPRLAWKHILGNGWRSLIVLLCAVLVAGFSLATTLIIRGTEASLQLGLQRLGADLLIFPKGSDAGVEAALFTAKPGIYWMPRGYLQQIAKVQGVARVTPHTHVNLPAGVDVQVVVFEPETDFTIRPWLATELDAPLAPGEAIAGSLVEATQAGGVVRVSGYDMTIKARLAATGTGLDRTLFVTTDTAQELARFLPLDLANPLGIRGVSQVLVQVDSGLKPFDVALRIAQELPDTTPVESPALYRAMRQQLSGLLRGMLLVLGITWALSIAIIGMVFSIATNERRREIGVLRVLGASSAFAFKSLLLEAGMLAVSGAVLGLVLAGGGIYLFHRSLSGALGVPLVLPPLAAFATLAGAGLAAALVSVTLAALVPALRVCRQDPAIAMRE